jgi:hypothetical protein
MLALTTSPETGRTSTSFPVGSSFAARAAAARVGPISVCALPGLP